MKKKSLQGIEDFYVNLGYRSDNLRKILLKDKEYQRLFKERQRKLTKKFKITSSEKKKYVLSTDIDSEILAECKQLERLRLTKADRFLVKFIKTQLETDWRRQLLKITNQLFKKYRAKSKKE